MSERQEAGWGVCSRSGLVVVLALLALGATGLGYAGVGWWWPPVEGMSLVRWPSFGTGEYEPMRARVTVMTGRGTEEGGAFAARQLGREVWREFGHPGRIVTWQALVEAPMFGAGSVEWLWDAEGRPTARIFGLGGYGDAISGAVLVEDPETNRTWLFERRWEGQ